LGGEKRRNSYGATERPVEKRNDERKSLKRVFTQKRRHGKKR